MNAVIDELTPMARFGIALLALLSPEHALAVLRRRAAH